MKTRHALVSTLTLGAMLLPSSALADDVHITLGLKHVTKSGETKLKVSGDLHLLGGAPAACNQNRDVVIQRRANAGAKWNRVKSDTTDGSGHYKKVVGDKQGQYRVVAPAAGACEKDKSAAKSHNH